MASSLLIIPLLAAFVVTLFLMPAWIRKMRSIGLIWENMNKTKGDTFAGSGGVIVLVGFFVGILMYIAYRVFSLGTRNGSLIEIFAILLVVIVVGFIGFVDDLFGWRRGGLTIWSRIIMVAIGSIPLIVINAGRSLIEIPGLGQVELGLLYPILFIPLGIVATTTTFNMLAGFNGLEAGQGSLILASLAIVAYFTGNGWLSVICLCMVAALIGFLFHNWYPAKVLPGDGLTYAVGAMIAAVAIVGNFERIAVFFYLPYIIEVILKSRGKLRKYSFGKPLKDGSLDLLYPKFYSLNHVAIAALKKLGVRATEKRAVLLILGFQLLVILVGFACFWKGLFS